MTTSPDTAVKKFDSGHRFDASRHWDASLKLVFDTKGLPDITRMRHAKHYGPLRIQRPFYPEGNEGCCHVYILHPPGGLVSGDVLEFDVTVEQGAHTLVTTPAANKLYKADSNNVEWHQITSLQVEDDGILEWLPLDSIAFNGTRGTQLFNIELGENAKCLGWELLCLGRPATNLPFESGRLEQKFQIFRNGKPLWIERQFVEPDHPRFQGKWGQGGATSHGTFWVVGLDDPQEAITALRDSIPASNNWAVTYRRGVLLLRYMGTDRNEAWEIFQQAREILRPRLTGHEAVIPRIWLT
ncbi:urease accessory protein UreD [Psychrobacter lutiphocae]|uniref:urease accessory protein UreD n=1 Tax=Psychrobacter lutiphocae TaxID=540500 RepID=UPI00035E4F0C|nr:urease accessory protein UreD [Psychrobacter lutiphocae]